MALSLKLRKEGTIRSSTSPFVDTRKKEINSLISQDVFKIIDIKEIP